ncbi:MAG: histidine triad nucleotide-binding protein [Candidatus Margulisbacteria bacterium]|nr:histidine triad nucleotide-binding protein [Candidatus Margulisiibacteriota bacterium]MBU1021322.1 histidine triad nucleotide-binding protein [Candidatus Margulisiibacteriota bacterium]MBU1729189.1 histidine triad nucleotide-binding protein [Candidatus Margulisiibacteriota bacterium]MBU1954862.1 histidine triad nucleotide-binding protein [Candidatus Margulisiibacteriota bacterium]
MTDCIFCKIINKEIKSDIVYEDEDVLAFNDIDPKAPQHILVIPKKHVACLSDLGRPELPLIAKVYGVIQKLVEDKKLKAAGYRVVVNEGKSAGQAVFHVHFHLLGGRDFSWPPG